MLPESALICLSAKNQCVGGGRKNPVKLMQHLLSKLCMYFPGGFLLVGYLMAL